jgi:hypothetical protein
MVNDAQRFPIRECGYAIGVLAVLAGLYVGAYLATVDREIDVLWDTSAPTGPKDVIAVYPTYPASVLEGFFTPIHRLDQMARPHFWSAEAAWEAHVRKERK